jgi:threonine dehydrogenase-like Zn-dependent dehydrogenase
MHDGIGTHFRYSEQAVKALVWHGGDALALETLPDPEAGAGQVVLDIQLAGICGSDLHPYRGHPGPRRPPLVLGHEAIGTVVGRKGRFAVFPIVSCGACEACERGEVNLCASRGLLGLDRPGVFADRVAVTEAALLAVPEGLDGRHAVLVEPLATALSALRLEAVGAGTRVLVVGGGPIGLLTVYAARALGARVAAVEPLAERRGLAERLGAAAVYESAGEVPAATADVAIDAVGVEDTWRGAIAAVRSGGRVAVIGLGQAEGTMPVGDLVRRGIAVRGHYAYVPEDFRAALDLLASDPPPLDWLTELALADGAEGFRRLVEEPGSVTKVLLRPGEGH